MKLQMMFASCLAGVAVAGANPALADPTYTTFDCPGVGSAQPTALNDNGVVAGYCGQYGFIRNADGTVVTFSVPGASQMFVNGMNQADAIVGYSYSQESGTYTGYLRTDDGTLTTFDNLRPEAINNNGVIAGEGAGGGFIRQVDGTITSFTLPGIYWIIPDAINDGGAVAGYFAADDYVRGFVRNARGTITTFRAPGDITQVYALNVHGDISGNYKSGGFLRTRDGAISEFQFKKPRYLIAPKINDHGEIIASYEKEEIDYPCDHGCRAFLREKDGSTQKITVPGYGNADATAINNLGWITGSYLGGSYGPHGFIRTP